MPRTQTWHDGKKAGFDANREVWKKERRFHQLNSRASTRPPAIAVFELAAAAADEAAQAALQALLARNDANLASLPRLGQTRSGNACVTRRGGLLIIERRALPTATLLGERTRYRPLATTTVACCRSSRPSRRRATPRACRTGTGAEALLREARRSFPFLERIIGDAGYQGRKMEAAVAFSAGDGQSLEVALRLPPRPKSERRQVIANGRRIGDVGARGAYDGGELRFQRFDLGRQLDRCQQLGPLGDNG